MKNDKAMAAFWEDADQTDPKPLETLRAMANRCGQRPHLEEHLHGHLILMGERVRKATEAPAAVVLDDLPFGVRTLLLILQRQNNIAAQARFEELLCQFADEMGEGHPSTYSEENYG